MAAIVNLGKQIKEELDEVMNRSTVATDQPSYDSFDLLNYKNWTMIAKISNYIANVIKFKNWRQILANRILFRGTGPTLYRHDRVLALVDHNHGDQDGPRSCLSPGLYDPLFEMLKLPELLSIVDLGANSGGFVLSLANRGHDFNDSVAIELNPRTWSRLVYNVYANVEEAWNKFDLLRGAAAGQDGVAEIRIGEGGVDDSLYSAVGKYVVVSPHWSLDSILARVSGRIDLLKIDVEGAEYEIIKSRPDLTKVDRIIIEFHDHPDYSTEGVTAWLNSVGFTRITTSRPLIEDSVHGYVRLKS